MKILIKNGRVVDPANKIDKVCDVLVEDTLIAEVAIGIKAKADTVIDASGKVVMPGLVDMHVHLREPGREDKETIASGTHAALKGGVTSVLAMPNTNPPMDTLERIGILQGIIAKSAHANVFICGAITKGRLGKELTDIAALKKQGIVAISDDGSSVESEQVMLEALKSALRCNVAVICHCEDKSLSAGGVINLGSISTRLGVRGISRESEYTRVERDIQLAENTAAPVHIAHVSCKESVEIIARAKKRGVRVTAETAPHYFSLSEEFLLGYDTNLKMNPPLRSRADVEAIKKGLKDRTIDVIASDHAPHTEHEKAIEFDRAEFGVIGLETELAVSITELVSPGIISWDVLVAALSLNPARILGINKGTLSSGSDADIIVVSPDQKWSVQKENIASLSKNSAFLGKNLSGVVIYTICNGKLAYQSAG
ncbi:MAG: dihydroorotase [Candidatus Omnitrophota bacterium]|jgi:dihydroorotase